MLWRCPMLWIPIIYSGCTQKNVKNADEPISTTIPSMRFLVVFRRFSNTPTIKRWCAQKCCQVDAKWMQRARNRLNVLLLNAIYPHVVSGLKPIFRSIKNTQDSRAISCRATVWRQKLHGSVHRVVSLQQPMFGQ